MKLALIDDDGTVIDMAESISDDAYLDALGNGVLAKYLLSDICTETRLNAYRSENQ